MKMVRLVLAVALAAVLLLGATKAWAQDGATLVAIVTAEPNAPLTKRVRAELQGLGVDVIVIKPPAEASSAMRAPLEQAARSVGAVAAVRLIVSSEGKVEIWVADRVTGKAVVRELDASSSSSDATVAVGTVELLRASLMELHTAAPRRGEAPATEKVISLALPPTIVTVEPPWVPRLSLAVGGGLGFAPGGLGASAEASLGLWVHLAGRLGARVLGHATLAPAHVDTAAGLVDVRSQLFGVAAVYDLRDPLEGWVPSIALGAAAAHVSSTGTAVPPFVSATDATWAFAPLGGAGIARTLARGLRLRADALAAFAVPTTRVRAPDASIGRWGAPQLSFSLGIELLWGRR